MSIFAYIDPGSGSLLLQAVLAALLSVPFFFRRTIGGAVQRLRGSKRDRSAADGSKPSEH
jgi:hypothetical protein